MCVRFVVNDIDEYSGVERGIVQAMYLLWHSGALSAHEEAWWAEIRSWLNIDLDQPDRLARSRRPGASAVAIAWFKSGATDHIARAREICALLAQHDIATRMLTTQRPGYIVYEDDAQVVAEPFRAELRGGN